MGDERKMKEVILNDECMHCKTKECHNGEHFCRQAMKDNSFYKNARLYKGLEVIQRPTYEELEKENAELKENNKMLEKGYIWHEYDAGEDCYEDSHKGKWVKRNEVYQLTKAKEIIEKLLNAFASNDFFEQEELDAMAEAEQFIKEE